MSSLVKVSRPNQNVQGDRAALGGGEKENLIPPMLLADLSRNLISTVSKSKKSVRTLADRKPEMEIISH